MPRIRGTIGIFLCGLLVSFLVPALAVAGVVGGATSPQPFPFPPRLGLLFPTGRESAHLEAAKAAKIAYKNGLGRLSGVPKWDLADVNGRSYVTTVKYQGACGLCVSYAALSALEATINYALGNSVPSPSLSPYPDLSESYLYYCQGSRKCEDGWYLNEAFELVRRSGVVGESCSPDSSANATCSSCAAPKSVWGGSVDIVPLDSWEAVKRHIFLHGPVVTGLTVYSDFPGFEDNRARYAFDSSYIWTGTKTGIAHGGHAITCHAFNDSPSTSNTTPGYVTCKNSWGSGWGHNGFIRATYGADGIISGAGNVWGFIWRGPGRTTGTSSTTTRKSSTRSLTQTKIAIVLRRTKTRTTTRTQTKSKRIATFRKPALKRPVKKTTTRRRRLA